MIKNTLELIHQTTGTEITFCYGEKAYNKFVKKKYGLDDHINYYGKAATIENNSGGFALVVGIKRLKDIYEVKGIVVHELSHTVSNLMKEFEFNCDEFRSYTLQWLYAEIMPKLDEWINKGK